MEVAQQTTIMPDPAPQMRRFSNDRLVHEAWSGDEVAQAAVGLDPSEHGSERRRAAHGIAHGYSVEQCVDLLPPLGVALRRVEVKDRGDQCVIQ